MEVLALVPNVPMQVLRGHQMIPDSIILVLLVASILGLTTSIGHHTKAGTK